MNNNKLNAELLKDMISLEREPVGVKFFKPGEKLPEGQYENQRKMRYCQALMEASWGNNIILSLDNTACAAAYAAFGFRELHPKLASGEAHFNVGTFGSEEAAKKDMVEMPRLPLGEYNHVVLAPLATIADFVPDVVVIEAEMEQLMWIGLAYVYETGERMQFTTSVVQATCVDATVVPFLSNKINATLGCTGSREASDIKPTEGVIGIPFTQLETVVRNLNQLSEKVIPKNRSKLVYERYKDRK
ncbi:MAG TPA: DUF169 domain-containing protein [Syntrophomonadaceae bacterium]|nr:DUF169 domain-containing protein [Syntrophomonadaceae bacterium]